MNKFLCLEDFGVACGMHAAHGISWDQNDSFIFLVTFLGSLSLCTSTVDHGFFIPALMQLILMESVKGA